MNDDARPIHFCVSAHQRRDGTADHEVSLLSRPAIGSWFQNLSRPQWLQGMFGGGGGGGASMGADAAASP